MLLFLKLAAVGVELKSGPAAVQVELATPLLAVARVSTGRCAIALHTISKLGPIALT